MEKLTIGSINLTTLTALLELQERSVPDADWLKGDMRLTDTEESQLAFITHHLQTINPHIVNEATIWARAIYPLLALAEQADIRAYAQIPISATYPTFEVVGVIDGVIAKEASGRLISPYLVVVEAKKGIGGEDPIPQLYAQLLASAKLKLDQSQDGSRLSQNEVFGVYTIADSWVFVKANVELEPNSARLKMEVETSREYVQRYDAARILGAIKVIIQRQLGGS